MKAIYIRTSTEDQKPENQIKEIEIIIMDNNILAIPEHFKKIAKKKEFIALASWGNVLSCFKFPNLKQLVQKSRRFKGYEKYFKSILKDWE